MRGGIKGAEVEGGIIRGRGRSWGRGCIHVMHDRSRMTTGIVSLQCRDGVRRGFTDQADIACTKLETP